MKAVLVFCEGYHDIVFVQRSLGVIAKCHWVKKRIKDLPSPFGAARSLPRGLIAERYQRQGLANLNLQQAGHPPLPSFESVVQHGTTQTLFLMLRTHGQEQHAEVIRLLRHLDTVLSADAYDVDQYASAFLVDANDVGVAAKLERFRSCYEQHFGDLSAAKHAQWLVPSRIPVGCFVLCASGQQTGTLEDELGPMTLHAWPRETAAAVNFIDHNRAAGDPVAKKPAERWKAIITAAGQFRHPGDPMSEVIGRKGLPAEAYAHSALSKHLVQFLLEIPWQQ